MITLHRLLFVPKPKAIRYIYIMYTPIRYVTFHFRDRRVTVSLRYRIRAEITAVLICVQKPYPEYGFRATTAYKFHRFSSDV